MTERPARRSLGLPGAPRPGEWQESAYPDGVRVEPVERVLALPDVPEPESGGVPLRAGLEAVLMVADEPVAEGRLAGVLDAPRDQVAAVLRELAAEYTAQGRGFELRQVAGGWRFYSRAECAGAVERFVLDGQQARLTQAALETLAVVAYRQPVSRGRVSAVRGVNCDGVMRTLVQRGLVEEAGTEPETGAILYRTTNYFLERMGLRGLDELPELAPFLPEVDDVEAESLEGTMIAQAVAAAQEGPRPNQADQTDIDVRTF
ncbi:segregation and condensation protein B [Kitasatospora cineracea]|uniref:Segregation and condensation protein B n=2 Tax=Kitasatospora cineracea TaxID=88074 RepID=A0A8G1UH67_9ACTN|nr:SMC-Scp complex subunit ScpB [Kitasatospora cineracea]ROR38226.1 segregation and condensation protein B [Kitasatospora cineracea]